MGANKNIRIKVNWADNLTTLLTLVTGIAPASLPFTEATVNSVLYGVWRAWQLTRIP